MVYSEHNNYGAMLVTDEGERMGLNDINTMSVQTIDDDTLENAMYYVKMFGGKFDILTKEFNRRVKEQGKEFTSVQLVNRETKKVKDSETIKKALVNKYGWEAVSTKSPTQLAKQFGAEVIADLQQSDAIETTKTQSIKWR
jgi:hypothetical protein|nr:MAG TPA: hypothetical protein [Caudoviricetes sp.]